MSRAVHIICPNVPWPADYGGAIASYYHLQALAEAGLHVHLHTFLYNRAPAPALARLCQQVHYYPRRAGLGILRPGPYIVSSRRVPGLLRNLQAAEAPILSEGTHCSGWLGHPSLQARRRVLRMHNLEHRYYASLARQARGPEHAYLHLEARRLRHYELRMLPQHCTHTLAISPAETAELIKLGYPQVHWLPSFHPYAPMEVPDGIGHYALYHGDLRIAANAQAVAWLASQVFAHTPFPLIVAGHSPPPWLRAHLAAFTHIQLIASPTRAQLEVLIAGAQLHLLNSTQTGGLKLKLLHCLYKGRHVLANENTLTGSGLEAAVTACQSAQDYLTALLELQDRPVSASQLQARAVALGLYDKETQLKTSLDALGLH